MISSPVSNQPSGSQFNWSSLIQLVLSTLAAFLLLSAAFLIAVTSAAQYLTQRPAGSDLTQPFMIAASLAFAGLLVLPSAWYSWKSFAFQGAEPPLRPERRGIAYLLTLLVLVLVVGALWLGNWVSKSDQLSWLLLPVLNVIATGLPALWLVYISTRGLITGSPRRRWGVFASGLVLGPLIIVVLELLVLIGVGVLATMWATLDPGTSAQLNNLVFRLQNAAPNQDAILRILLPFLLNPEILFIAFAFISVLVPLIEEAFKPIGVWFLMGQKLTPAQGFAYGILSGTGFGLFENLGNTSAGGEAWAILAATRISTLLLHGLTAGLVGWALASAWSQRRYLRLGLTYAFSVVVHGLWNGLAVISSVSSLEGFTNVPLPASLAKIGNFADLGIYALGALILAIFIGFSLVLRRGMSETTPLLLDSNDPPDLPVSKPDATDKETVSRSPNLSISLPQAPGDAPTTPQKETGHSPSEDYPDTNSDTTI